MRLRPPTAGLPLLLLLLLFAATTVLLRRLRVEGLRLFRGPALTRAAERELPAP
jgi:hypothetical protein